MLINFSLDIFNSNPLPDAEPILFMTPNSSHYKCIDVTNNDFLVVEDLFRSRMEFWNGIYDENKEFLNTTFKFAFD